MTGIERVAHTVHDALVDMSGATVSEQEIEGDAKVYNVQIGDDTVTVNVGAPTGA